MQNPLKSIAEDGGATRRILALQDGPTVLGAILNPQEHGRSTAFKDRGRKATTIELASSHVSMLSHPREIADLILSAAGHKG